MAKAIKCDRCGTYTQTFDQEEFKFIVWESKAFFKNHINVPVDLCQNCLKELEDWFEPGEEKELGQWLDDHGNYKCSDCGVEFSDEISFIEVGEIKLPKYCPHCGLEKKQEGNNEGL